MAYRFTYKYNTDNYRKDNNDDNSNLTATTEDEDRINKKNSVGKRDSTENISNLISKILIDKRAKVPEKTNVISEKTKCNTNEPILYVHNNFMDTLELAYLLDYYVNENKNGEDSFCCFLFGSNKIKENTKTVKSIVIPNEYIHQFDFNLIQVIDKLTIYIKSMYKCYSTYKLIGWMLASLKSGL